MFGRALAICVSFGITALALASKPWARYRLYVQDQAAVQRLLDSNMHIFSENVQPGETDVCLPADNIFDLVKLNMPFSFVSTLPSPDAWAHQIANDEDDYRLHYLRYDNLISLLETWRAAHPDLIERQQIATTLGNRAIWAYRIYRQVDQDLRIAPKNMVITCGIHAREWISESVGLHAFKKLVDTLDSGSGDLVTRLTDKCAVYFIPCLNPDGYEYTFTNDRYWRKNRRPNAGGSFGVDLNRNYGYKWGMGGSSANSNSDTYRGTAAFSERETSGVKDFVATLRNVVGFIDWHSYSQLILWPWSYTDTLSTPDNAAFSTICNDVRSAILSSGGVAYTAGQSGPTLYIASGVSVDYMYANYNSKAITIELRDTGTYGFALPETQIIPTQDENWAAFQRYIQDVVTG